ncbi:hypothetical protein KO505_09775 [Psychrosphaera sp. F3M07]|jgi:hypothetical protein|uniref:hypothetical protein n=1 Tax=Psychrosphaera sp. F3M07 TaxID=2841560 RepID=UPI001C0A19DA|nr:hypothetical protein [Psychrosphaera sp. F3M07]MBU2918252.1 hypothetical protein [Psychrosphaera sp. F3M07]
MKVSKWINLLLGIVGLIATFWLSFNAVLPLTMYLLTIPLIVLPSIVVITQALENMEFNKKQ